MKNITGFFILLIIVSCNVGKREQIEQIVTAFEETNISDKREVVFNVQPVYENGKIILNGETSNSEFKNGLLKELDRFNFTDNITLLPDSTVGTKTFALINVPVANLKAAPSHSAELVTQAILGTPVKILKKYNDWFYVQTPDRYISWVDAAGISPITKGELENWRNSERVICKMENSQIFSTKNFENPVSDVTLGCILQNINQDWNSIHVQFPDGRTGFVKSDNWNDFNDFKNSVKPISENIVLQAQNLIGRSYLWGGTSANAMDCSGFVKTVYFMNGIILARDASLQTKHGQLIDVDSTYDVVEAGDLLFFGTKATNENNERVTHVALSLGKTEYIHASGWIKQNSFDSESDLFSAYRKNSFVRARRIIDSKDFGIREIKDHPWY